MDPVAHTLFGAALAESGLKRRSRYATATLLIGANLPDVDVVAGLWGGDVELLVRRGWTHGVLAMLALPLLLVAGVALWHRWRGGAHGGNLSGAGGDAGRGASAPPFRARALIALAFLAVWSHPLLDLLNTYGVRLLMPFDGRWFYGDTLFIVEPWFWLLTAAGVVLARSADRGAIASWTVLGLAASLVVLGTNLVPLAAKLLWCAGVALIAALRWRRPDWLSADKLARAGLVTLLLYIGAAWGLARLAETRVAERFSAAREVQANPVPANPFTHRVVVVEEARYRIVAADVALFELPRRQPDAVIAAALAAESIRGFANWMRYPYYTVEEQADRWTVTIQDLRYQGPDTTMVRGFGAVQVDVPKAAGGSD